MPKQFTQTELNEARLINIAELSRLLGVPVASIYKGRRGTAYLRRCAIQMGGCLHWQLSFVLNWIAEQQRKAAEAANVPTIEATPQQKVLPFNRNKKRGQVALDFLAEVRQRRTRL